MTCQSMGYSNGTFYSYHKPNNLTSHIKMFMPKCSGNESSLLNCPGTRGPEQGRAVCEHKNLVSLHCEGFHRKFSASYDNWAGVVFQKYAPYRVRQQFTSLFTNSSLSEMDFVDVEYAGLHPNRNKHLAGWWGRPKYDYVPGSAITVFQYAPKFSNLRVEKSLGNGLNLSNIEAPVTVQNSVFLNNRGHGIVSVSRFGNVKLVNSSLHSNLGDGFKYAYNNSDWSVQEQKENFLIRYIEFCDSQNPLSYPAYYKFKNPNYVKECSKVSVFKLA